MCDQQTAITTLQDTLTLDNTRQLTGLDQLQFVYKKPLPAIFNDNLQF
jgi:hypothetical protein